MTMPATKLAIVVERLLLPNIERRLQGAGIAGYSVFQGGGHGSHGDHPIAGAAIVGEFQIVKIEVVVKDRALAERLAEEIASTLLEDQSGVVWLESVEIVRPGKFKA